MHCAALIAYDHLLSMLAAALLPLLAFSTCVLGGRNVGNTSFVSLNTQSYDLSVSVNMLVAVVHT